MNSWNQNNNFQQGFANFTPYQAPSFNPQMNRTYSFRAEPIQGQNAAWQFQLMPNSDIWIPDANEDLIWWIKADQYGNKTVMPFDIKPHQQPEPVDTNNLAERLTAVEEWINAKSNKSNAKRSGPAPAATE